MCFSKASKNEATKEGEAGNPICILMQSSDPAPCPSREFHLMDIHLRDNEVEKNEYTKRTYDDYVCYPRSY